MHLLRQQTGSQHIALLYLTSFLVQLGTAMTVSYVPIYARELGAALVLVGVIETARSLGAVIVNIPGGLLVRKGMELKIFLSCFIIMTLAACIRALSPSLTALLLCGMLLGSGQSLWILARLTYLREAVSPRMRGRVMAGFGGLVRLSRVAGPLIGSAIIVSRGYSTLFLAERILLAAALILLALKFRVPQTEEQRSSRLSDRNSFRHVWNHYWKNRGNIHAAMIGIFTLTVLRASRMLLIPLWSLSVGLTVKQLGLITSITALVEIALVVPAGYSIDKFGRKPMLILTLLVMAAGIVTLNHAHDFTSLLTVSLLIGLGNGIGSGINMIFSTDLAPDGSTGLFIAFWRVMTEIGMAVGPLLVGIISSAFTLGAAVPVIASFGLAGALIMLLFYRT
jgi:MFS family permease